MADKTADLIEFLGTTLEGITTGNGFNNTVVAVTYGFTTYNSNNFKTSEYPRIHIIANQIQIPNFSTKVCSETKVSIKVVGYLRKESDVETSLETYKATLGFSQDIRKGIRNFLANMPNDIDGDLIDNSIGQEIGFPMTLLTCETEFGIIFEDDLNS